MSCPSFLPRFINYTVHHLHMRCAQASAACFPDSAAATAWVSSGGSVSGTSTRAITNAAGADITLAVSRWRIQSACWARAASRAAPASRCASHTFAPALTT